MAPATRERPEIHGPHDIRGDAAMITLAAGIVRRGDPVQFGPPLGGGVVSFEDDRIACVTFAAVCDPGTARFDGLELELPDGAIP